MSQVSEAEWIADWRRLRVLAYLDDPTPEQEYEYRQLKEALVEEGIERYKPPLPDIDNNLPSP